MTAQLALGYPPAYVGGEAWRKRLDVLRLAVNHLGLKEVAFVLDVAGSMLSDSLNERDRKRWAGEWVDKTKAMLVAAGMRGDAIATDILRQLCEIDLEGTSWALVDSASITPEEEAAALRRELLKFGDRGKEASVRVGKGRRR